MQCFFLDIIIVISSSTLSPDIRVHRAGSQLKIYSIEVQLLANIVSRDIRTTTGRNLNFIQTETGLDPWRTSAQEVGDSLVREPVPDQDQWRLPLLCQFLNQRDELETSLEDTKTITELIDSLCSS